MSTDFEEAVIAFAQALDATWSTAKEVRRVKQRLIDIIDSEFEGSTFAIAMKRIVEGSSKAEGL